MVRALDVDVLSVPDAVVLVDWFAGIERLAAAGKTLAAGCAIRGEPWRDSGERSAADWLAKRTGSTVGEARGALDTAKHLASAPQTDDVFRDGGLSPKQAEEVASAAAADPTSERRLLDIAQHESLQKLRDEAARVRAAADPDPTARHERIRRNRFWKRWTDRDGARRGSYCLTPEDGALLEAAAQRFIDRRIDEARRAGEREPSEAYAADGLLAMAMATTGTDDSKTSTGDGEGETCADGGATDTPESPSDGAPRGGRGRRRMRNRRELIALVDVQALHRGSAAPGETCEIAGVGPVPVDVVRQLFGEALLRVVIRDGVDIRTVVHTGRIASALQETAVLVRDGGRCIRPCCGLPISEIDHRTDYTASRVTTLDDLGGLCGFDHDLKTRHGHTYRRLEDGTVEWLRPDGTVERGPPPP